ncbi:extracelular serine carboxypeptidase-like protein [Xylariaceae sp. FL0594]|nr:extracelular serine carboxypeptidase-like protein [Xylariaceae sp. FL0594]
MKGYRLLAVGLVAAVFDAVVQAGQRKRDVAREDLTYAAHYFQQKINHFPDNHLPFANETFTQRYYFDSSYYKPGESHRAHPSSMSPPGSADQNYQGGPVYLYISGETSGPSRFSNLRTGIVQILMQATNGLGVILENRYYGQSYPFNTSTTDQLAFLSTAQTIADNSYFAQHAVFPGINHDLTAPGTPWILYGGSLAGAQTAFSIKRYGDVLYGGIASSAPIHVVVGYPEWYNPIQKYAPQDCVARINNIIDKFDALVARNNTVAIKKFKELFGLGSLTDHRDFASAIVDPIGNPGNYLSNTWQELNWNSTYGSRDFFYFCGNVTDNDGNKTIAKNDYALSHYTGGEPWVGLGGYAHYIKTYTLPLCSSGDPSSHDCWGTQNQTAFADITNSASRSYLYTSCTEQGAYIDAPKEGPSLLSRVIDTSYEQQWCTWAFPKGSYNQIPSAPDVETYNSFGNFGFSADRLAFIDGDQDVWNGLCYHSPLAPVRNQSIALSVTGRDKDLHPEHLITGAGHHWDSSGILDVEAEPQFIREAHRWEIRMVRRWLSDFDAWKASRGGYPVKPPY